MQTAQRRSVASAGSISDSATTILRKPVVSESEADRLRQLHQARAIFQAGMIRPLTVYGYGQDWLMFEAWCAEFKRAPLPATSETVALYLTDLLEQGKKITTARRRKCAIAFEHRKAGYPTPITSDVLEILAGAQRIRAEKPRQMRPLTVGQLRDMSLDLADLGTDVAIRNRALLIIGFASALRRSNLAALNLDDVEFCREGLILRVQREKNDPECQGRLIGLPPGQHAETDPVETLRAWLDRRGRVKGPLFCRLDAKHEGQRMDGECVARIVKKCVRRIGLDPDDCWGAHSLRAGLITAMGENNVGVLRIGAFTNQSPEIVKRYFRRRKVWEGNPVASIGL